MTAAATTATATAPATLSKAQTAARLGVSPRTIRRWVANRGFPPPKQVPGGRPRFVAADVERWLQTGSQAIPPGGVA